MIKEVFSPATYGAAGATVFLGMTIEQWGVVGVVVGILIGLADLSAKIWCNRTQLNLA